MAPDLPTTIPSLLRSNVSSCGADPALGLISNDQIAWTTWKQLDREVRRYASHFQAAGIRAGDRVAQWAPNSLGWILTDLALATLGAVHVPLHTSLSRVQVGELLQLADPKLLVVDQSLLSGTQFDLPVLTHLDSSSAHLDSSSESDALDRTLVSWDELDALGIVGGDLATILYTSGTTGQPRGVMLSHENLVSNAIATTEAVGTSMSETRLCFLPLSHIYARTCDLYSWLYRGSRLVLAESRDTIVRDCQLAKPQVINGVPYFYQKIAQQLHGAEPGALQRLLGGELTRCFCGGAAVAPEVEKLFEQQGLPLLSGYGLTEASPVIAATAPDEYQAGTVGPPLPNLELRLSEAGEILVRGPSVMLGYWNAPEATAAAMVDGWLYTGDLGELDASGHLRIVGRQKEIIVLSTGKNVSPTRVEQCLAGSPLFEHVCVVGNDRKYLGALIVPNPDALRTEIRRQRLWVWSRHRAVTHPKVRELFRTEIQRLLTQLSSEEQVGCFTILARNFSVERGELTAKLSLRREMIAKNLAPEIARMYAS
jgi:long-chain acyl-CoA synthetase